VEFQRLLIAERVYSGQQATLKTRHLIQSATASADGKKTDWRTRQAGHRGGNY
jgi:hypothetical protein